MFDYDLKSRSSKRDREQIHAFLGFRPITIEDEEQLRRWLELEIVLEDMDSRHLRLALADWCRDHRLEPPADISTDRLIASAVHGFEERFFHEILSWLPEPTRERLDALVATENAPEHDEDSAQKRAIAEMVGELQRVEGSRARPGCCIASPSQRSATPMDRSATYSSRWSGNPPWRHWSKRARPGYLNFSLQQPRPSSSDRGVELAAREPRRPPQADPLRGDPARRCRDRAAAGGSDLRVGFTEAFKKLASREVLSRKQLQERLLRCLYGQGTNAGLKRMAESNQAVSYANLPYVRRRFVEKAALREAVRRVVNATLAAPLGYIWGEGATACASDSKKFGAWDQNLMTEWHIRYGARGVMIYWHVERRATCIYSQLKRCSSSELAAMIEGVLHYCTDLSRSSKMTISAKRWSTPQRASMIRSSPWAPRDPTAAGSGLAAQHCSTPENAPFRPVPRRRHWAHPRERFRSHCAGARSRPHDHDPGF